jgi:phage tail-like protein
MAETLYYPVLKFRFKVRWENLSKETEIGFTEVTGLDYQVDLIEYSDGINILSKRKLAGRPKFSNVILKRGVFKGLRDFYDWMDGGENAKDTSLVKRKNYRRTVTITLMDEAAVEVVTWNLSNAFPLNIKFSDLKADGNEVAIETIELVHEGLAVSYH